MVNSLLDTFVERLREHGADATYVVDERRVIIRSWEGRELEPSVSLKLNPDTFDQDVRLDEETRSSLWPDSDQYTGGINLLLVHLDEIILSGNAQAGELILTAKGVQHARQTDNRGASEAVGTYRAYSPETDSYFEPEGE